MVTVVSTMYCPPLQTNSGNPGIDSPSRHTTLGDGDGGRDVDREGDGVCPDGVDGADWGDGGDGADELLWGGSSRATQGGSQGLQLAGPHAPGGRKLDVRRRRKEVAARGEEVLLSYLSLSLSIYAGHVTASTLIVCGCPNAGYIDVSRYRASAG